MTLIKIAVEELTFLRNSIINQKTNQIINSKMEMKMTYSFHLLWDFRISRIFE